MVDGIYDLILKTPLGVKKGVLTFVTEGETLKGLIQVKEKSNTLQNGKIDGNHFYFESQLDTPVGKLDFVAEGEVENNTLKGKCVAKKGTLTMTGTKR